MSFSLRSESFSKCCVSSSVLILGFFIVPGDLRLQLCKSIVISSRRGVTPPLTLGSRLPPGLELLPTINTTSNADNSFCSVLCWKALTQIETRSVALIHDFYALAIVVQSTGAHFYLSTNSRMIDLSPHFLVQGSYCSGHLSFTATLQGPVCLGNFTRRTSIQLLPYIGREDSGILPYSTSPAAPADCLMPLAAACLV